MITFIFSIVFFSDHGVDEADSLTRGLGHEGIDAPVQGGLLDVREEQELIFEKFYRSADERVAQLPGTGLGLAIARQTVQAHGGTIELESEPGKGSIFIVSLNAGKASAVTR